MRARESPNPLTVSDSSGGTKWILVSRRRRAAFHRGVPREAEAKMQRLRSLCVIASCWLAIPSLRAQTKETTAAEAKDHIGDLATVCGESSQRALRQEFKRRTDVSESRSALSERSFHDPDLGFRPREVWCIRE